MAASIPASAIVAVQPQVINAGGSGLDLVGLILTDNTRVPIGTVRSFASAADVAAFFGPISTEATLALVYFNGYDDSDIKPAALRFSQYARTAVSAYLRGGPLPLTLTQLQALNGVLTLAVDGRNVTSSTINLGSATSFSDAATTIQTALADQAASGTASITGTTLTVTGSPTGTIAVGQNVVGTNVAAGTVITALGTGTGGAGTYTVNTTQTAASGSVRFGVTTVVYDSTSGAFVIQSGSPSALSVIGYATGSLATSLVLTQATGATVSAGSAAATPTTAMATVVAQTQDFASFMTSFKPSASDMYAFAAWTSNQNNRFLYVMWDNDIVPTTSSDTSSVGYLIGQAALSGTAPVYDPTNGAGVAAFLMGAVASIDFNRTEGRVTLAFRSSAGLTAGVMNQTIAQNLIANGYNFYGAYATANDRFVFLYPGQVSGPFDWLDSYVNQIWMNAGFQLSLMNLLVNAGSIPYNVDGYALIEAELTDQIIAAFSFGAIRPGVTLTALQIAEVNSAAGRKVSDVLQVRGWYVLVADAAPSVRAARGSPPVYVWYTDGQSVQRINLSSVLVQ